MCRGEKMKKMELDDRPVTLTGIVVPVDWDEEGNALASVVSTPGEKEYLIEPDSKGKELLRLSRREVKVVGLVGGGRKGRKTISVRTFELI
jgi:hypothetical protein